MFYDLQISVLSFPENVLIMNHEQMVYKKKE